MRCKARASICCILVRREPYIILLYYNNDELINMYTRVVSGMCDAEREYNKNQYGYIYEIDSL